MKDIIAADSTHLPGHPLTRSLTLFLQRLRCRFSVTLNYSYSGNSGGQLQRKIISLRCQSPIELEVRHMAGISQTGMWRECVESMTLIVVAQHAL